MCESFTCLQPKQLASWHVQAQAVWQGKESQNMPGVWQTPSRPEGNIWDSFMISETKHVLNQWSMDIMFVRAFLQSKLHPCLVSLLQLLAIPLERHPSSSPPHHVKSPVWHEHPKVFVCTLLLSLPSRQMSQFKITSPTAPELLQELFRWQVHVVENIWKYLKDKCKHLEIQWDMLNNFVPTSVPTFASISAENSNFQAKLFLLVLLIFLTISSKCPGIWSLGCSFGVLVLYIFELLIWKCNMIELFSNVSPTGEVWALNHGLQRATNQMMWSLLRIGVSCGVSVLKGIEFSKEASILKTNKALNKVVKICKNTWQYVFVLTCRILLVMQAHQTSGLLKSGWNRSCPVDKSWWETSLLMSSLQLQSGISSSPVFAVNLNKSAWSQKCSRIWNVNT